MNPRHSISLLLVWRVANLEALHRKAPFLSTSHLLLGLCKVVDLDPASLVPAETPDRNSVLEEILGETRRLRRVFENAQLDPQQFRRRFRQMLTTGSSIMAGRGFLHRTDDAKDVFAEAERMAALGHSRVFPVHLLCALLSAKDPARDQVLTELGVDKSRLMDAATTTITVGPHPIAQSTKKDKTRWN